MKFIVLSFLFFIAAELQAESTRVQIYERSQQYWDVKTGESLSFICQQLIPGNRQKQRMLQKQIFEDNADAFINNSIDLLIAGKRLWLPGSYRSSSRFDKTKYDVKTFNWGSIKTPK